MAREYVEKNTAEMVRCLKELVAIPEIFGYFFQKVLL